MQVTGISRAADPFLDTKLRSQTAGAATLATLSGAYSTLESGLGEPGASGLSAQLQTFWNGWHDVSNAADTISTRSVLLDDARQLTEMIHTQYQNVATQWADARTTTASLVTQTNTRAANVAVLNKRILDITNNGGNANELSDQRDQALTHLAGLVGATVQTRQDGQVDVYVGGDALVFGGASHAVALAGASSVAILIVEAIVIGGHILLALRTRGLLRNPVILRRLNRGAGALMVGAGATVIVAR